MDLDETLTSRDTVNSKLRLILDEATDKWGIKVTRVELKNISPPRDIQDAMEKQMRAERERREAILRAEGEKRSAILKSEGEREAQIQTAEGQRQAAILKVPGRSRGDYNCPEGQSRGCERWSTLAIKEADPTKEVVAIRSLEALEKVSEGKATKILLPVEAAGVLGALSGIKDIMGKDPKEPDEGVASE